VSDQRLQQLGARWTIANGELRLSLKGAMARTGEVAARAGKLADEMDHHPTITLEYAGLELAIHSHDAKAITDRDWRYADVLEAWLRANGWNLPA
jgi:4a-hydroxytetrahydrobiopterin dehydratase